MTFAWNQASSPVEDAVALGMVRNFLDAGCLELDPARIYSGGESELMLGRVLGHLCPEQRYRISTKAHPSQPNGLSAVGIRAQLEASLKALGVKRVDVLYLHQPDPEHDLAESLACVDALIKEGKVGALGLSNYSALETERCCNLCIERNWSHPSFYQGLYNPLNRLVEDDLLPVLRRHGISFIAFNPLAAGLLSGKHALEGDVLPGRFKDNPNYLPRFYTDANFTALQAIRDVCNRHDLEMVPSAYAWLLRHSALDVSRRDGILLGASGLAQFEENLAACLDPPTLPDEVARVFDEAWNICKEGAFPYWRSYSKDQPGREGLDPGASYQAHGPK
jgi:aflatoxin B1 aldehyde reductase